MQTDLKIIQLEKDIIGVLKNSGVAPTVLQLVLMKIQNDLGNEINALLAQFNQQLLIEQQKQKQEQENKHIINSEEENKEGV